MERFSVKIDKIHSKQISLYPSADTSKSLNLLHTTMGHAICHLLCGAVAVAVIVRCSGKKPGHSFRRVFGIFASQTMRKRHCAIFSANGLSKWCWCHTLARLRECSGHKCTIPKSTAANIQLVELFERMAFLKLCWIAFTIFKWQTMRHPSMAERWR